MKSISYVGKLQRSDDCFGIHIQVIEGDRGTQQSFPRQYNFFISNATTCPRQTFLQMLFSYLSLLKLYQSYNDENVLTFVSPVPRNLPPCLQKLKNHI